MKKTSGADNADNAQAATLIREDENSPWLVGGRDFIDDDEIEKKLRENISPDPARVRDIFQKSLAIETLQPEETAALLNVSDRELLEEMFHTAGLVKHKVYDSRIVTFAPLYCSNLCVNNCLYCSFRTENRMQKRRRLSVDEVRREVEFLAGEVGHKRLIMVYGEHPTTGVEYIAETIAAAYDVKVKLKHGVGEIRRVNVNAAPMGRDDLKRLRDVGLGTYQIFQETYSHGAYAAVHPAGTLKSHYQWRLYSLHRALDAGLDDVAIGALFGLYNWRFEVMGLLQHARDLERHFGGIGPHTVSFPRLEPAANTPFVGQSKHHVTDEDFLKLVAVLRLSIPYAGMIVTARESAEMRRRVLPLGCTQTDASTRIGVGSYSDRYNEQEADRQQFLLGDTRSLDELILEFSRAGYITSFCTAGYRCGRRGDEVMKLLKCGREAQFCKLNAVLTFREWLDDFASPEAKKEGEIIISKELGEIEHTMPGVFPKLMACYERTLQGERDIYF